MTNWDRPMNGVQRAISVRQRPAAPALVKTNRPQGHPLLPHWTSPNGLYCGVDSDEDSGIGHSNNGCPSGDRVGSTSSAEADINCSPSSSSEQFNQYSQRRLRQWPPASASGCQPPPQPLHHIIRNRGSDGQAPSTSFTPRALFLCHRDEPMLLDSSCGSTDEVFHSFCAYLGGQSSCSNVGHHKWRPSPRVVSAAGGVASNVVVAACNAFPSNNNSKNWNCCVNSKKIVEAAISVDVVPTPRRRDLLLRGGGGVDNDSRARRVWSYSGESSRYANIYENMHCSNSTDEPMMISVRAQPLQNSVAASGPPKSMKGVWGPSSSSGPIIRWPPQRAQSSTSLASLITVDSDLIRVHATPAAVISVGDDSQTLPLQPPLPPLPPQPRPHESSCYRECRSRAYNGSSSSSSNYYESVHSVASSNDRQPKVRPCDLKVTTPPPLITPTIICADNVAAGRRIVEVQYAQVQKPKKVSKKSSNGGSSDVYDRIDCPPGMGSPSTPDVDSEPPLPPRNYRRNSVRNVRTNDGGGGGSRSSLAERVQDFTRSAKQALRRALSLDALHGRPAMLERAVPKTRTSPRGWDHDDDDDGGDDEWGDSEWRARRRPVAVNQRPCRTPAAVKAKDAARFKAAVTLC